MWYSNLGCVLSGMWSHWKQNTSEVCCNEDILLFCYLSIMYRFVRSGLPLVDHTEVNLVKSLPSCTIHYQCNERPCISLHGCTSIMQCPNHYSPQVLLQSVYPRLWVQCNTLWKGYPCASCCSASHDSVLDMSTGDEPLNSQSISLTCELGLRTAQRPFHTQEMHFALARHSFWMCQVAVQMWSMLPLLTSFTIHWRVWCNAMSIVSWIQLTSQHLQ